MSLHLRVVSRLYTPLLWRRALSCASARQVASSENLSWSRHRALLTRGRLFSAGTEGKLDSNGVRSQEDNGPGLQLSDSCVEQLLHVTEGEPDALLRIVVEGGGCSGFQYKFELDSKVKADDKVFERGGARVVIDELSLSFLAGSTVDYHRELIRSSFRIIGNPNAELACSCGASFALK